MRSMRGKITFFILGILGMLGLIWAVKSVVYGQEGLALSETAYSPMPAEIISLIAGGSFIGVLIRFAQRKFQEFKQAFDFLTACAGLILLSPLFLIISILIKIDSHGAVFLKQKRVGKDGGIFGMWKFRTMRENAELETGPVWAGKEDPRITRLGHFLRKTHIDELPQLLNVFKGNMSLIGPCPERPVFVEKITVYIPKFNGRLKVKPGITGLAQVRHRYSASIKDAAEKLKYDLLYIKKMCWTLDIKIIFWTIGRVLSGEGAR